MAKAKASLTLTGEWGPLEKLLNPRQFNARFEREIMKATRANGALVAKAIRDEIKSGVPPANAALTKILKSPKNKPLIGKDAALWTSIGFEVINSFVVFAGVNKTAKGKNEEELSNIGWILHEGATVPVTAKMRAFFWDLANKNPNIFPLKASTTSIVIPARPFLKRAMKKISVIKAVEGNWETAVSNALFDTKLPLRLAA